MPETMTKSIEEVKADLKAAMKKQGYMTSANKHWKRHGTMRGFRDCSINFTDKWDENIKKLPCRKPFANVMLNNNRQKIHRLKAKLLEMDLGDENETID